ncbi:hypothetical protein ACFRAO_39185 [Streptomyces sp. NPDC056656]
MTTHPRSQQPAASAVTAYRFQDAMKRLRAFAPSRDSTPPV